MTQLFGAIGTLISISLLMTTSASPEQKHFHPKGKPPSKHTIAKLEQARAALPFADKRDFEEQQKGFIAAPKSRKIMADAGGTPPLSHPVASRRHTLMMLYITSRRAGDIVKCCGQGLSQLPLSSVDP